MLKRADMERFEERVWLASPTMHGDEMRWVQEAFDTNWMSTVGANINEIERLVSARLGCKYAVALASGTAALHLAMKLAGVGPGDEVLCSDVTFAASVNPVVYEGGVPVFVDSERDTWNMDPKALERAFELHPKAKAVALVHLYGTPARMEDIERIAHAYGAVVIEDAAEALGAKRAGKPVGALGDVGCISFNGNKIITGSTGGMLLTDDASQAELARKWSTQSREAAPWYQHECLGYNHRMSNVVAGVVRGQLSYLDEHIERKRAIHERYREGLADLPVKMNPFDEGDEPNYWLSCMTIDADALCVQRRGALDYEFSPEPGKSCPHEVLEALAAINAEGRPIWKPMHMQPVYGHCDFVTCEECAPAVGEDIFARGVCLPSDIKMSADQQDRVIDQIGRCFE